MSRGQLKQGQRSVTRMSCTLFPVRAVAYRGAAQFMLSDHNMVQGLNRYGKSTEGVNEGLKKGYF